MKHYFASIDFKWLTLQILLPLQLLPHEVEADRDPRKVCLLPAAKPTGHRTVRVIVVVVVVVVVGDYFEVMTLKVDHGQGQLKVNFPFFALFP